MNIDSGDSSLTDDHGLKMDSVTVTHDNPSENLDSILDASTEDPGIHTGPSVSQPPSTTIGGDSRSVNCGLNMSRVQRHTLEITAVRNLIQRWVESQQVQVSSDNLVCQSCWTIAWDR